MPLDLTPEVQTVIQHLEAARAAELGFKLTFESHDDLQAYRRKLYIIKRKILDSGQGDFSDILARISSDDPATLLLIKQEAHSGT